MVHSKVIQARRNEIHIGGRLKREASEAGKNGGPGGLPPGKSLMATSFRLSENAPFLENVLLTEAKDHN